MKEKRWDLYDKGTWISTDDACELLFISKPGLTYRLKTVAQPVAFRIIQRGSCRQKIYNRKDLMLAMAEIVRCKSRKKRRREKKAAKRWITQAEACALYGLTAGGLLYQVASSGKRVATRRVAHSVECVRAGKVLHTVAHVKEYDADALDAAIDAFLLRKRSLDGQIPRRLYERRKVRNYDRWRVDVLSSPRGRANIAAIQHLGLDCNNVCY